MGGYEYLEDAVVYSRFSAFLFLGFYAIACSSDSSGSGGVTGGAAGALGSGGGVPLGSGGMVAAMGGQTMLATGGTSQVGMGGTRPIGTGGATVIATGGTPVGAGGTPSGGNGGMGGSTAGGGSSAGGAPMGGNGGSSGSNNGGASGSGGASGGGSASLTGTLGSLGAVKPIVNAWVISNSGETLIYLSTAPLTCMMMQTMGVGWLSMLPAGSQVVEIVVKGAPTAKTYPVGLLQGEVNYAPGGKPSSYETSATGGSIMLTMAMASGPVEGSVMATYAMGSVMGTFHAEFCPMGSQY